MAEKIIEKRNITLKITNFTREAVNKYEKDNRVESEKFKILLGDNGENMTEWSILFYPKKKKDYSGIFIKKFAVDRDDFLIKLSVVVQKSDGSIKNMKKMEHPSKMIPLGTAAGLSKYLDLDNIFKAENKYILSSTLTLIINLELHQEGLPAIKTRLDLALPEWIAKLFNSEELNDITIVCSDEKSIPAHRNILAGRSAVFKAMFTTDMAEKKSNKITLADDSDTMLELMRYIYTQEIQDLEKHARKLLDCAEKYDIPDLKQICVQSLVDHISDENIFENLLLAKLYNDRQLMNKCMDYIDTNFCKLKDSEQWEKVDRELMFNIMKYMQEKFKGIELINSL